MVESQDFLGLPGIMQTWTDGLQPFIDAAIRELEPVDELRAAIAAARYGDDESRAAAE